MQPAKSHSQDVHEKPPRDERAQLIQEILRNRESLEAANRRLSEQQQKREKIMQSNLRNEKRLQRYRARVEEMNKYKDSPEHFLTLSGYMNEAIQEYIFSHNCAFDLTHNNNHQPDPDRMSYQQLIALGEQIGKVSKGLSKEEIDTLHHRKNMKAGEQCPICQNEMEFGEVVIDLKCKHAYHEECISFWLKDENTCPICKEYLATQRIEEQ